MIAICAATVVATAACSGAGGGRGATQSSPADVALASAPSALPFPDAIILPSFHSKRFELSLPLPDGKAWRIDDHSHVELVASHAPTRSKLVVYVFADPELMSRQSCEEKARARGLVPNVDMRTVEDHVAIGPETYDTRLWVTIAAPKGGDEPLLGHVFAFGGFLRKCLFFHYSSEVSAAADEDVLSARLAVARLRIFGGIAIDPFAEPPRERR